LGSDLGDPLYAPLPTCSIAHKTSSNKIAPRAKVVAAEVEATAREPSLSELLRWLPAPCSPGCNEANDLRDPLYAPLPACLISPNHSSHKMAAPTEDRSADLAMTTTANNGIAIEDRRPPRTLQQYQRPEQELPCFEVDDASTCTTLVFMQLPEDYTRDMVTGLMLDASGFAGAYDFVYVPMDLTSHRSFGYAFVNALTPDVAGQMIEYFAGYDRWVMPSKKTCKVLWGKQQGLYANIKRYQNSPVMHASVSDAYKPALFSQGLRVSFPLPTKILKAPQKKQHGSRLWLK